MRIGGFSNSRHCRQSADAVGSRPGCRNDFAEKELVEQPFPVIRVLSHQIACSFRDPGETHGLLAKWRPGLWDFQGTRLRGMGPVNLSMAAVGPERACPWLCIANAGGSCTTYSSLQVSTSYAYFVGKAFKAHDLRSSASLTTRESRSQEPRVDTARSRDWRRKSDR